MRAQAEAGQAARGGQLLSATEALAGLPLGSTFQTQPSTKAALKGAPQ